MICDEIRKQLDAYVDHELDAAHALNVEQHLKTCSSCQRAYQSRTQLRTLITTHAPYHAAPAVLREKLLHQISDAAPSPATSQKLHGRFTPWLRRLAVAAAILLAAALGWQASEWSRQQHSWDSLAEASIAAHVRSMMPGHLTDVASTDQHTVKPWFGGKIDFSPPVADPAAEGFPLVGGRLDFLNNQPVAALVYQRRKHVINLFVWPAEQQRDEPPAVVSRRGFNVLSWSQAGWSYQAVSDLNETELREFHTLLKE